LGSWPGEYKWRCTQWQRRHGLPLQGSLSQHRSLNHRKIRQKSRGPRGPLFLCVQLLGATN
jgi:hypothetical protein